MTLEMREAEIREETRISYMIVILRRMEITDEQIIEVLRKHENLSKDSAKEYLQNASSVVSEIEEHITFMRNLCQVIAQSKKQNLQDDVIQLKLQKEFGFDDFDAEFFFNYVTHSEKYIKIMESFQ